MRSLSRLRHQQVKKQTRIKNQIKSYLDFYGHKLPKNCEMQHWSRRFIEHLRTLEFNYDIGKEQLNIYIEELLIIRNWMLQILILLKKYYRQYELYYIIDLLRTVPGVGFTVATTLYSEIMDIKRFSNNEKFASFIGLIPSTISSGEKKKVLGLGLALVLLAVLAAMTYKASGNLSVLAANKLGKWRQSTTMTIAF